MVEDFLRKMIKVKKHIIHNLCLIIYATDTIFFLPKLDIKFQPDPLEDFLTKGEKSEKTHKLCLIVLINTS